MIYRKGIITYGEKIWLIFRIPIQNIMKSLFQGMFRVSNWECIKNGRAFIYISAQNTSIILPIRKASLFLLKSWHQKTRQRIKGRKRKRRLNITEPYCCRILNIPKWNLQNHRNSSVKPLSPGLRRVVEILILFIFKIIMQLPQKKKRRNFQYWRNRRKDSNTPTPPLIRHERRRMSAGWILKRDWRTRSCFAIIRPRH